MFANDSAGPPPVPPRPSLLPSTEEITDSPAFENTIFNLASDTWADSSNDILNNPFFELLSDATPEHTTNADVTLNNSADLESDSSSVRAIVFEDNPLHRESSETDAYPATLRQTTLYKKSNGIDFAAAIKKFASPDDLDEGDELCGDDVLDDDDDDEDEVDNEGISLGLRSVEVKDADDSYIEAEA